MDVVGEVPLVIELLPQNKHHVEEGYHGDGGQLPPVSDGVGGRGAECPTDRHTQQQPYHLTLRQHL